MKKILITLTVLFVSEISFGQIKLDSIFRFKQDTISFKVDTSVSGVSTDSLMVDHLFNWQKQPQKTDTVPIIMLVCDTSRKEYETIPQRGIIKSYFDVNNSVHWSFGYEVRSGAYGCCDPLDNMVAKYYWFYTHLEYLDENKKPLSPSIIVWLSKNLK
jgi:hypothetical protein